jgi:formamidopyrimidine-DNA glycosylase
MLELPEAITLARQISASLAGEAVRKAYPPTKPHKFTWFLGDPADYDGRIEGSRVLSGESFGSHAEIVFDNGMRLDFSDGAAPRLYQSRSDAPTDY